MIINKIQYLFVASLLLALTACNKQQETLYVVNVLDEVLYNDAHIKGSIQASLTDLADKARSWNKDATVVTYCSNYACTASSYAARMLQKMGFKHVYAYEGGMAEWYQLHKNDLTYAVDGDAQESYLQVVMAQPEAHPEGVAVITAQELKDLLAK